MESQAATVSYFGNLYNNSSVTCNEDYLQTRAYSNWPLPNYVLSIFSILNVVLFFVATVGNALTFLIIVGNRRFHSDPNIFLCNLAISDFVLIVVGVALEELKIWRPYTVIGGQWFCFFNAFVLETVNNVSVLTITTLCINRWSTTVLQRIQRNGPQLHPKLMSVTVVCIWLISCAAAYFHSRQFTLHVFCSELYQLGECDIIPENEMKCFAYVSSLLFFFIPIVCIMSGYTWIGCEISANLRRHDCDTSRQRLYRIHQQSPHNPQSIIRLLIAVVFVFFISHLPLNIQRLLDVKFNLIWMIDYNLMLFLNVLYFVAGSMHFASAAANPFLYFIFSKRFRVAFSHMLNRRCRMCRGRRRPNMSQWTLSSKYGFLLVPMRRLRAITRPNNSSFREEVL